MHIRSLDDAASFFDWLRRFEVHIEKAFHRKLALSGNNCIADDFVETNFSVNYAEVSFLPANMISKIQLNDADVIFHGESYCSKRMDRAVYFVD